MEICPGYRRNHHADQGVCCCGLYWTGTMPAHDEQGHIIPLDRFERRASKELERAIMRQRDERYFRGIGAEHPLPYRPTWKKEKK